MDIGIERIKWIDCAKGIAILLVIIGHTIVDPLRGLIFSFHMPLFFIVAGAIYKYSNNWFEIWNRTKKSFIQLMIPAIAAFIIRSYLRYGIVSVDKLVRDVIWGSGVAGNGFEAVGMVCFLYVMFEVRFIADCITHLMKEKALLMAGVLTFLGVIFGKKQWLPFSLDIAFAVLIFFVEGAKFKKFINKIQIKQRVNYLAVLLGMYIGTYVFYVRISHAYLELATRSYPMFGILPYITAYLGTAIVCIVALTMEDINCWILKKVVMILRNFGQNSLLIFLIHYFDILIKPTWCISSYNSINAVCRVIVDILIYILIKNIRTKILRVKHRGRI